MNLSIIIVNYFSGVHLRNLIASIHNVFAEFDFDILIVNNGDKGGGEGIHLADFSNVSWWDMNKNIGFAKANNHAANYSNSDYLLFLNPDTLVTHDFITPIINFIENQTKIGACGPTLIYENGRYQSSSGFKMGFCYEFMEAFMFINIYRFIKSLEYKKETRKNEPVKVGWVSGACLLIKRSVFESVGRFTESYFLNYEDIDLCKKLEDEGYNNYLFPHLRCVHLDHKSFDKNYKLLVYSRYESRLIYAKIYYSFIKMMIVRLMHIFGIIIRIPFSLLFFKGIERTQRYEGYKKSLKLYLNIV